ncbi:MAG: hypothetical protein ACO4CZ_01870, partial [Planctomycetota bacterium]
MRRFLHSLFLGLLAVAVAPAQQVEGDVARELTRQARRWENGQTTADELTPWIEAAANRPSVEVVAALLHLASAGMDG